MSRGLVGRGGGGIEGQTLRLRIVLHTMNLCLQNSFWETHIKSLVNREAVRKLNAIRTLPVNPILRTKSQKGQMKNGSSRKPHEKNHRTN